MIVAQFDRVLAFGVCIIADTDRLGQSGSASRSVPRPSGSDAPLLAREAALARRLRARSYEPPSPRRRAILRATVEGVPAHLLVDTVLGHQPVRPALGH